MCALGSGTDTPYVFALNGRSDACSICALVGGTDICLVYAFHGELIHVWCVPSTGY